LNPPQSRNRRGPHRMLTDEVPFDLVVEVNSVP
jgi:hypothetical protein